MWVKASACFRLCTGGPESTLEGGTPPHPHPTPPPRPVQEQLGSNKHSLRMDCILLETQGARHREAQQQGAALADRRRRCPERSGSSLESGSTVAAKKEEKKKKKKEKNYITVTAYFILSLFFFFKVLSWILHPGLRISDDIKYLRGFGCIMLQWE